MSEKKSGSFLKHFAIIGSGTVINMFLSLLVTPLITRIVDPTEYGQLSIFTTYGNIAVMVLCMGMDQTLVRYYHEGEGIGYRKALLFRSIRLPLIFTAAAAAVFMILTAQKIIPFEFDGSIAVLLCVFVLVNLIYRFSQLLVRMAYKSKLYSLLSVLQKLSYICIVWPLLLTHDSGYLFLLVLATILSQIICMVISILAQKDYWNPAGLAKSACVFSGKELYRYGAPFILSMGIATLFEALDKIQLNHFTSYVEVGIYSSALYIINIFAIIQTTFNTLWAPMAMEHYAKDREDRSFYQKGNGYITIIMFFCGLSLIAGKDLFALLLGEKYRQAAYILPFLIFHPIMYTISETTVTGISFMKKTRMHIYIAAIACAVDFAGNAILIPLIGCQGAAIATGSSYIVFFILRTVIANHYFPTDFRLKRFAVLTLVTAAYALWNSFEAFSIWSLVGYAVCLLIMWLLYRDTIRDCIAYLRRNLKTILKRNR